MRLETPGEARREAKHWQDEHRYQPAMFVSRRLYCVLEALGFDMRNFIENKPLSVIIADDPALEEKLSPEFKEKVKAYYGKLFDP